LPQALDRVIHTLGWPLRAGRKVPRVRRLVHLPDGFATTCRSASSRASNSAGRLALGARPAAGAEDASAGAERSSRAVSAVGWGAKAIPRGAAFWSLPASGLASRRGDLRRRGGLRQRPQAEGRPLRAALGACSQPRRSTRRSSCRARISRHRGALDLYDAQVRESEIWSDLHRVRNMRQGLREGPDRRRCARGDDGHDPRRTAAGTLSARRQTAERPLFDGARTYPAPGRACLTFDKLSSVFPLGQSLAR